jgi:serine/threonine protein kinase/Tol biopolymer transport system component
MSAVIGSRLGPYEILSILGAGGMGEVYRARDTRLQRDVAIKVLPAGFSTDPERLARFEREARAAAALNHPNILAVYDIGQHDGLPYIVSELLEGETLRERLNGGSIPIRKAVEYAVQIADGLAAAHERGIVHRDLKPENIFVTVDGRAKILDFGLAKLTHVEPAAAGLSLLPTALGFDIARPQTIAGVVLGTVGYMAPEQVRGLAADHRADLFAFGAILYETLSGHRAFKRDTATDTLFAIVKEDPTDLMALRDGLAAGLDRIVRHCLEKAPAERFQSARDIAFALEQLSGLTSSGAIEAIPAVPRRMRFLPWVVAGAGILTAALTIFLRGSPIQSSAGDSVLASVAIPPVVWFPELSPDGRRLAAVGVVDEGKQAVWVRELNTLDVATLPGSENATGLFWFPDSQSIGILTEGKLQRVSLAGGPPQVIAGGLGAYFAGASANRQDVVLYTQGGGGGPLYKISPNREPTEATVLNSSREETAHAWPQFLPDNTHFIYMVISRKPEYSGIYLGSIDSAETRQLLKTDVRAEFVQPGFLVFVRDNAVMAQRFDPHAQALAGNAQPLVSGLFTFASAGVAAMTVSPSAIVYLDSFLTTRNSQLTWIDRSGKPIGTLGDVGDYVSINLSHNDSKLAISLQNRITKSFDIWIGDVQRGLTSPFFVSASGEFDAQWSPNDDIAFSSDRNGPSAIFRKSTGAGEPMKVVDMAEAIFVSDWSRDGRYLLCQTQAGDRVYAVPMTAGASTPRLVLESPSSKDELRFSPDVHWIAYDANDTGRSEVYVVSFPDPGAPIRISVGGGVQPRWRRDGKEIFYLAPDGTMMTVAVRSSGPSSIDFGVPQPLFRTRLTAPSAGWEQFDVSADGQRFIVITPQDQSGGQHMNLLLNWTSRLK